jgi:hypothetical protein
MLGLIQRLSSQRIKLVFLPYLLALSRFLDLREMGMTLLLPSLSLYTSSMKSRSFLLRLKIFLELLSAQSSNWAKVKPNTSLSADFFISSAPELNRKPLSWALPEGRRPSMGSQNTADRKQWASSLGDTLFITWKRMKGESCVQVSVVRAARSVR